MKSLLALLALVLFGIGSIAASTAHAASPSARKTTAARLGHILASAKPTITIVSPSNGAVITGNTLTVTVKVSNFKLVKPVLKNPPPGKAGQGEVQFMLNGQKPRVIATSTSHTWTRLSPGKYTVVAYLANSAHVVVHSVQPAEVTVTFKAAAPPPTSTPKPSNPAGGGGSPGVGSAPTTGGAASTLRGTASADSAHKSSSSGNFNVYLLLAGLGALVLGLLFLGRRYAFATTGPQTPVTATKPAAVEEAQRRLAALTVPTDEPTIAPPTSMAFQDASSPLPSEPDSSAASSENQAQPVEATPQTPPLPSSEAPEQVPTSNPFAPPTAPAEPVAPAWDRPRDVEPATSTPPLAATPAVPGPEASPLPPDSALEAPAVTPRPTPTPADITRSRALDMAHQWASVVEDLVAQLERQEQERIQMLARLDELEDAVKAHDSLRQLLAEAGDEPMTREDLQAVQYVTDSLVQDPDHIVVLASVAQHADRLARVVKNYARIQKALGDG